MAPMIRIILHSDLYNEITIYINKFSYLKKINSSKVESFHPSPVELMPSK